MIDFITIVILDDLCSGYKKHVWIDSDLYHARFLDGTTLHFCKDSGKGGFSFVSLPLARLKFWDAGKWSVKKNLYSGEFASRSLVMKWYALLALALFSCSFSSCASNTDAGKTLNGVNQAGQAVRSVQAIQSIF
jgi:hypothetical protein